MSAISKSDLSLALGTAKNGPGVLIYSYLGRKAGILTAQTCKQANKVYQLFKEGYRKEYRKEAEKKLSEEDQKLFSLYGKKIFDLIPLSRFKRLNIYQGPEMIISLLSFSVDIYKKLEQDNVNLANIRYGSNGLYLAARVETVKPSGKYVVLLDCRHPHFNRQVVNKVLSEVYVGSEFSGVLDQANQIFFKSLMEGLPCFTGGFGLTQDQTLLKGKPNIRLVQCKPESKKTEK